MLLVKDLFIAVQALLSRRGHVPEICEHRSATIDLRHAASRALQTTMVSDKELQSTHRGRFASSPKHLFLGREDDTDKHCCLCTDNALRVPLATLLEGQVLLRNRSLRGAPTRSFDHWRLAPVCASIGPGGRGQQKPFVPYTRLRTQLSLSVESCGRGVCLVLRGTCLRPSSSCGHSCGTSVVFQYLLAWEKWQPYGVSNWLACLLRRQRRYAFVPDSEMNFGFQQFDETWSWSQLSPRSTPRRRGHRATNAFAQTDAFERALKHRSTVRSAHSHTSSSEYTARTTVNGSCHPESMHCGTVSTAGVHSRPWKGDLKWRWSTT